MQLLRKKGSKAAAKALTKSASHSDLEINDKGPSDTNDRGLKSVRSNQVMPEP